MIENKQNILSKIDLLEVYKAEVENFKELDNGLATGLCPLCGAGSFCVFLDSLIFKCLDCGAGGTVQDLWQQKYGTDFETAMQTLADAINADPGPGSNELDDLSVGRDP